MKKDKVTEDFLLAHIDDSSLTERGKKKYKIKSVPICPELMALKPFVIPQKGFSYDEVLSLIQKSMDQYASEKIKRAIELARIGNYFTDEWNDRWKEYDFTPEEILQKLSE